MMAGELTCSRDSDDEYEKLVQNMNPPRVVIDNASCANATVIHVDSVNKYGILLEVVQAFTDLNLIVKKAYISSDGEWFMDVFNVTDRDGKKIIDEDVLKHVADYVRQSLGGYASIVRRRRSSGISSSPPYTSIELTGTDRPGLLSEVSAVLTDLKCNVVNAEVWTHNNRAASVMHVTDEKTGAAITDPVRLEKMGELLRTVLRGSNLIREAKAAFSWSIINTDRRLHQLMLADRDYERCQEDERSIDDRPKVSLVNWSDKDYSVVTIRCKDRPKLLFDTVCTLTDMKYVVFHGNVDAEASEAYQEYFIRHIDGSPVNSEAEKDRVIQCLEAAIERRVSEGLVLELCTADRFGLLSEVTRIFRENGLTVTRAEVSTRDRKADDTFYVRATDGGSVDAKNLEAIRQEVGQTVLKVRGNFIDSKSWRQRSPAWSIFGGLFRARSIYDFGSVKSWT